MKVLALFATVLVLGACSTVEHKTVNTDQYCHTSSVKTLKDGSTSSSEVTVECSDKPNPKATMTAGMDGKSCGWARQVYPVGGRMQVNYVMACQLQDGSWTYVPNHIAQ